MEATRIDPALRDETELLRRCLREVVALSELTAGWGHAEPGEIPGTLAERLLRALSAELVYVRLERSAAGEALEAVHTPGGAAPAERTREIGAAIGAAFGASRESGSGVAHGLLPDGTGGDQRLVVLPVGRDRGCGLLAACSARPDFPAETERLLLEAAADHASLALERRRAEEALRETEQRFTRFTQHLPGLAWIKDLEGRYVYANDAAEAAFRTRRAELYGRTDEQVFPPETASQFRENDRRVADAGRAVQTVETLEHADGLHYSLVSKFPIPGADGKPALVGGIAIDITERKRAEDALRESEARFRHMADSAPVLVWLSGTDRLCTWFNRPWLEFVGQTLEQQRGEGWAVSVHPEDLERCREIYESAFDARRPFTQEYRLRRHDGEYRWVLDNGIPLYEPGGEFAGYIGSCVDITDQKRTQEALERSDRQKDEFLARLAHELRNPLAPIRNGILVLRMSERSDPQTERVHEMMERQVNHVVRLVDDLLEVSRIARGRIRLRKERVELERVVRAAVEASWPALEAVKHELAVSLASEPLVVEADPVRLTQVLSNLIDNAAKYTDPGGRIRVTAEREGGEATIRVRDSGIGIAAELLPRVFDMFAQAEVSERSQNGLGIGLSLVRSLVEMHGGRVHAESAGPGMGSEFTVRLPLAPDGRPEEEPAERPSHRHAADPPGTRILVVDDNHDAAESLAILLGFLGNEVRTAHDGRAALDAVLTYHPAAVLLDIGMPEMDGYEVARRIRAQPGSQQVVLIALTGWGQEEDRRRARAAGFDHHLIKPVDLEALKEILAGVGQDPPASDG